MDAKRATGRLGWLTPWVVVVILTLGSQTCLAAGRTYYASPNGGGAGSRLAPFKVNDFWKVAKPGDTLLLVSGRYVGPDSMITPPSGLRGTAALPITVSAQTDGAVQIDGESKNKPVSLNGNSWFVLQGFDACRSSNSVVEIALSNNCIVRRVCAWDAADNNTNIFGVHNSQYNLVEDCAGWGIARKIFSSSQHGDYTTFRRCWGRWEGSHVIGPKSVFAVFYNSYHNTFENCIGTWDAQQMQEPYTLMDYDGHAIVGADGAPVTLQAGQVDQPYGIFAIDGHTGDNPADAHTVLSGCVAYVLPDQSLDTFFSGFFVSKATEFILDSCVSVITKGTGAKPFLLADASGAAGINRADNLTAIGPESSRLGPLWSGTLITNTARPPSTWPMNDRIRRACGVDVEAELSGCLDLLTAALASGGQLSKDYSWGSIYPSASQTTSTTATKQGTSTISPSSAPISPSSKPAPKKAGGL